MSPRNPAVNAQKRELSKSKILDAAQALFTERGYDATTMAQVSRHAAPDDQLAAVIDAVLQTAAEQPQIIAMHLALLLQPDAADMLADAEHHWEDQLADILKNMLAARGDSGQAWLLFRATLMGAAYGIVSPYMPMPYTLTRERLFAQYHLNHELGSPPHPSPA